MIPFGDSLLKDLEILLPKDLNSTSMETVISLAKCFPQLELSDATSLDKLREEYLTTSYHQVIFLFLLNILVLTKLNDHVLAGIGVK